MTKPRSPEILHDGTHLRFVRRNGWEFVERKNVSGIAILVAITEEGRVLFVEQRREPVGADVLELPAGLAGDEGEAEDPMEAANRELEEETGYRAAEIEILTEGPPSPGLSDEIVTFYLARRLTRVGRGGGVGAEDIRVHEVPFDRAFQWLEERRAAGRLVDPKVFGALALAARRIGGTLAR
ncbi:MAG TPA: NUDIX hydrolase [Thermoanaerobaculia bacterium]